jgi:hypothetical protein
MRAVICSRIRNLWGRRFLFCEARCQVKLLEAAVGSGADVRAGLSPIQRVHVLRVSAPGSLDDKTAADSVTESAMSVNSVVLTP